MDDIAALSQLDQQIAAFRTESVSDFESTFTVATLAVGSLVRCPREHRLYPDMTVRADHIKLPRNGNWMES